MIKIATIRGKDVQKVTEALDACKTMSWFERTEKGQKVLDLYREDYD
jgi:hypothetical protein